MVGSQPRHLLASLHLHMLGHCTSDPSFPHGHMPAPRSCPIQSPAHRELPQLARQHPALMAPSSPTTRTSMESAEALYNQLEEELHDLVFQSNSSLERLEFLRKVRELEAEFSKVRWASLRSCSGCSRMHCPLRCSCS